MDEELDKAIQELIEAGVGDDEIKSFIRDYSKPKEQNPSAQPEAVNAWSAPSVAMKAMSEGNGALAVPAALARGTYDLGRSAVSFVTDQLPQQMIQAGGTVAAEFHPTTAAGYVRDHSLSDYQKFVRKKLDIPWHTAFDQKYFEDEDLAQEYLNSTERGRKVLAGIKADAPENIAQRVKTEQRIQGFKEGAANKMAGANQDVFESNSLSDVMSAAGSLGGQVLGQIPLSILTGGLTSYAMESAAVSDNQLDRIAKKYGISREEAIKRGYDRPTEGQVVGMIAGALDAMSAGEASKVKGLLKAGDKATLGKLLKSPAAMSAYEESITEPTQGVLEELGGAQGAGVSNTEALSESLLTKEGLKRRGNEALGGLLGTGVGHAATTGAGKIFSKKEKSLTDVADHGINEADYDVEVPNAQVNNTLDRAAELEAIELNRMAKELGIDLNEGPPASIAKEEAKVDKVIDNVLPEAKTAAMAPAMEIGSILGKPEAPIEAPAESAQVIPQPVAEQAPAQRSTPIPDGNIKPLYRTSQNEMTNASKYGAPDRGGIMHAWNDEKSDISTGIFTVEPSLHGDVKPSDRTDLLVPAGRVEKAHPAFKAKDFGEITTQINMTRKPKLLKTKDTGMELHTDAIIEAAQKSKDVNQDAMDMFLAKTEGMSDDKRQSSLAAFLRTKAGGEFDGITYKNKAETSLKEKAVSKAPTVEEDNITYINKANKIVDRNADTGKAGYRPSQQISALEKMLAKVEQKGLADAVKHIQKLIVKVDKIQQDIKAEKQDKASLEETKASRPPKEEKEGPKMITYKGQTKSQAGWQTAFYKQIGAAETEHVRKIRIAKYNQYREESGIGFKNGKYIPVTEQRIAQILKSETATKGGKKLIADEKRKATREAKTIAEAAAKENISVAEYKERQKKELIKQFEEGLELPEGTIEDVDLIGLKDVLNLNLIKEGIFNLPKKEITFDEFKQLAPSSQNEILNGLFKVISRYKGKEGSGTRFIQVTVPHGRAAGLGLAGFHFSISKSDNSYVAVLVDEKTGRPLMDTKGNTTALHEYLHDYTKMMYHRLYKSNKSFAYEINRVFDKIKETAFKNTESLIYKQITGDFNITEDDANLMTMMAVGFLDGGGEIARDISVLSRGYRDEVKSVGKAQAEKDAIESAKELTEQFYSKFNAFENANELMADGLSDPHTMMFLSKIKMDERIASGINKGERKSLLYKWAEILYTRTKKLFEAVGLEDTAGNALEYMMDAIGSFDQEFMTGELERNANPGMFADFDPSEVRDIEAGIDVADYRKILNKQKTFRKVISNITHTLEPRAEIKTLDDVKDYISRVNAHLDKKLDKDLYGPKILAKIKKIRKQREKAKTIQAKLVTNAKNRPEYKTSWKYRSDVDDWAAVRIEDLKAKAGNNEVGKYLTGMGLLSLNGVPSQESYNIMINYGKKLRMLNELLSVGKKLNQTFFNKALGGLQNWTNPATFASIISKYDTATANKVLKNIYGGAMVTMARASIESSRFFQNLSKLAETQNFTHKDLAKIGIYGAILSTVSQPNTVAWEAEVLSNAKSALAAAKNKLQAKADGNYLGELDEKLMNSEIKIAEQIFDSITKKGASSKILTDAQQKYYEAIKDFAASHEADFERNSVGNWGNEDFQKRWNYFPTLAQGSVEKGGKLHEDELLRGEADNLFEAMSTSGKKGTYGYVFGKKVWSNYRRTNPKGYFYEYDALAIAKRWSKTMLYDLYASKEMKAINRVLSDPKFRQEYNAQTRDAFKRHLVSISGSGNKVDSHEGMAPKWLLKWRDRLYTAALATSGQILLQSSSGFVAAAVMSAHLNPVTSMRSFARAVKAAGGSLSSTSKLQKFLEDEGMGIQIRDILFEKYLSPEDYQKHLSMTKIKGITNKIENVSEWSLRAGDKLGARLVWFAAYFDAGGTLENPSKQAVLAAERVTGVMQNMSDMSFAAPAFKYDNTYKKILMGMFMAFKSFSINSALNIYYSTRYSTSSKEARQVLTGQLGAIFACHTLAVMAIRPLYKALAGDDDDEDKKGEAILTESLWDLAVGMVSPTFLDAFLRYVYNKGPAKAIHGSPYHDFDQYADSPIFSATDKAGLFKDMFSGGPGFKDIAEMGVDFSDLLLQQLTADKYMEEIDKADKRDSEWNEFLWKSAGTVLGGITGVPFRGDAKRILYNVASKKKKRRAMEAKAGKGSGKDSGDTEYQLP